MTAAAPELDLATRRWRVRIFTATWLSYFGYYFCRKPFYITKATLEDELGFDPERLAAIGTAYLVAYAIGQFLAGWLGNRHGPRIVLLVGMALTIVINAVFGITASWVAFAGFMFLNGLAQGTGWSGNVGAMAPWFTRRERGTVMGLWATNFQAGGVAANALAATMLGMYGYRWAFFAGSVVLLAIWVFFFFNQRNRPEDVGLQPVPDPDEAAIEAAGGKAVWTRPVVINVLVLGVFYFNIKFIRYALWSWAPYLLQRHYGLEGDEAGFASTTFDIAGILGVIALGFLSDRLFGGRRVGLSFVFLLAMLASTALLYLLGASSLVFFTVCLGLIGFSLYGPDAILTSAGATDVGSRRTAILAAGIINGMGSVGSVVQEVILGRVLSGGATDESVGVTFGLLLTAAILAAACLALLLVRNRQGKADL